jgi:hypothetical protein
MLGLLVLRWRSCTAEVKSIVLVAYGLIFLYSIIELNRELFLILGITYVAYYNFNVRAISVKRLFAYSIVIVPFFLVFKYVAYWLFFGKAYDGGVISFGELVNWSRWTDIALLNGLDLGSIQADDLGYFLTSLVYPFSNHEISSEVLFTEILGKSGVGQSYGYSGPLWAYGYLGYAGVFLFYFALSATFSALHFGKNLYLDVLALSLMFLTFRFFRQEWVIPIKTLLWVYFYPSVMLLTLSRLTLRDVANGGRIGAPSPGTGLPVRQKPG